MFFLDPKRVFIISCHDDAVNVIKTSKILEVETYQHCCAHLLHLLLTKDSINKYNEVTEVIQKCKDVVTALHFKSQLMGEELAATGDKTITDCQQQKIAKAINLLELDEQFLLTLSDDEH